MDVGPERLTRFAARLNWLADQASGRADQRSDPRIVAIHQTVETRRADGQTSLGKIIDLSMTGAAIAVDELPPVGEAVTVGKHRATMVRHLPAGFAVTFRLPFRPETFGPHVKL